MTTSLNAMVRKHVIEVKYGGRPSEKYMDVQWLDGDCWGIFPHGCVTTHVLEALRSRVFEHFYHHSAEL